MMILGIKASDAWKLNPKAYDKDDPFMVDVVVHRHGGARLCLGNGPIAEMEPRIAAVIGDEA